MLEQPAPARVDVEACVGGLVHVSGHSASRRGRGNTLVRWTTIPITTSGAPTRSTRSCSRPRRTAILTELTDAQRLLRIQDELRAGFDGARAHRQGGVDLRLRPHAARPPRYERGARRSRGSSARRASRSSPAAARGSWRPRTAARARPGAPSIGLGIELPHEQSHERATSTSALTFHYFFTRKVMFVRYASGVRGLPRRLRDARRAVRGRHAAPDAARSATSRSCWSARTTGAGWSTGCADPCSRERQHRPEDVERARGGRRPRRGARDRRGGRAPAAAAPRRARVDFRASQHPLAVAAAEHEPLARPPARSRRRPGPPRCPGGRCTSTSVSSSGSRAALLGADAARGGLERARAPSRGRPRPRRRGRGSTCARSRSKRPRVRRAGALRGDDAADREHDQDDDDDDQPGRHGRAW